MNVMIMNGTSEPGGRRRISALVKLSLALLGVVIAAFALIAPDFHAVTAETFRPGDAEVIDTRAELAGLVRFLRNVSDRADADDLETKVLGTTVKLDLDLRRSGIVRTAAHPENVPGETRTDPYIEIRTRQCPAPAGGAGDGVLTIYVKKGSSTVPHLEQMDAETVHLGGLFDVDRTRSDRPGAGLRCHIDLVEHHRS